MSNKIDVVTLALARGNGGGSGPGGITQGQLNAAIAAEAAARTIAINNETTSRTAAISEEATARAAAINNEQASRETSINRLDVENASIRDTLSGIVTYALADDILLNLEINEITIIAKDRINSSISLIIDKTTVNDIDGTFAVYVGDEDENGERAIFRTITISGTSTNGELLRNVVTRHIFNSENDVIIAEVSIDSSSLIHLDPDIPPDVDYSAFKVDFNESLRERDDLSLSFRLDIVQQNFTSPNINLSFKAPFGQNIVRGIATMQGEHMGLDLVVLWYERAILIFTPWSFSPIGTFSFSNYSIIHAYRERLVNGRLGAASGGANDTSEVEVVNSALESISGESDTQKDINVENVKKFNKLEGRIVVLENGSGSSGGEYGTPYYGVERTIYFNDNYTLQGMDGATDRLCIILKDTATYRINLIATSGNTANISNSTNHIRPGVSKLSEDGTSTPIIMHLSTSANSTPGILALNQFFTYYRDPRTSTSDTFSIVNGGGAVSSAYRIQSGALNADVLRNMSRTGASGNTNTGFQDEILNSDEVELTMIRGAGDVSSNSIIYTLIVTEILPIPLGTFEGNLPDQPLQASAAIPNWGESIIVINEDEEEWEATEDGTIYFETGAITEQQGWLRSNVFINDFRAHWSSTSSPLDGTGILIRDSATLQVGAGDKVRTRVHRADGLLVPETFYVIVRFVPFRTTVLRTGTRGPQGATGQQGLQGIDGPQGIVGPQGIQGESAIANIVARGQWTPMETYNRNDLVTGDDGNAYILVVDSSLMQDPRSNPGIWTLFVARGAQGAQGIQGPQGIQGQSGGQGLPGPQGIQGPIGPQGEQGERGLSGMPGMFKFYIEDGTLFVTMESGIENPFIIEDGILHWVIGEDDNE